MNRWWFACLLMLLLVSVAKSASADDLCPVCGNRFGSKAYSITKQGRDQKVIVCEQCAKLETECYICGVPVKHKFTKLADGRLLCEEDAKQAVLDQHEAEKIFDDVKRDAQSILARLGSLPHHNIRVILEAKPRLDKTGANVISKHDDRLLMGLTRTQRTGEDDSQHTIYLLHGLTRERLMAVAAHEYGHAWLHENVRRKLNSSAVEGFCDWLAYKVIKQKNATNEIRVLLESDYSEGQLQAFIAAEDEHRFNRVIQWVKVGVDPEIERENLKRVLVLREAQSEPAEPPFAFAVAAPPRPAPTNLVLKGLSGSKLRRFALINDGTFAVNEQGKVRLGESNVVLRCVAIHDDAVTVHVSGESAPRRLPLKASNQ